MEPQLAFPSAVIVAGSPDDRHPLTVARIGFTDSSQALSSPTGGSAPTGGLDADELDLMILNQVQVSLNSASKSMLSLMDSSEGMATTSGMLWLLAFFLCVQITCLELFYAL